MEMMPMIMELDQLPEQYPLPFENLSKQPFAEFSSGSSIGSSTSNHPTQPPQPQFSYPYSPPLIMQSQHFWALPEFQRPYRFQQKPHSMEVMRDMVFRMAALQPLQIDPESIKPVKRRNVKTSNDPQTVAARHRRERISERIRILQRLVPGGAKMDTASMLDEAAHYMKFLKRQVESLEQAVAAGGGVISPPPEVNVVGCCTTGTTTIMDHHGDNSCFHLVRTCGG